MEKQALVKAIFHYNPKERESGDDIAILFYSITWITSIILLFTGFDALRSLMDLYLYFDLCCIVFIAFYLWMNADKKINVPNAVTLIKQVIAPIISIGILYLIGYVMLTVIGDAELVETTDIQ